jgi:hypothetical protein
MVRIKGELHGDAQKTDRKKTNCLNFRQRVDFKCEIVNYGAR